MSNLWSAIDELATVDRRELSDDALTDRIKLAERAERRIRAIKTADLGELDRRQAYKKDGARTAGTWLSNELGVDRRDARRQVKTAGQLEALPDTAGAFAEGEIGSKHAEVIAQSLEDETLRQIEGAEQRLIDIARRGQPGDVRREAERLRIRADEDAATERANRQYQARRAWFEQARKDGMTHFHSILDPEGTEYLRTVLDHLIKPEPSEVPEDERRTGAQRMADALVELSKRSLDQGEVPIKNGQGPTILVRTDIDALGRLGCRHPDCDGDHRTDEERTADEAGDDLGGMSELVRSGPISAETLRRLICQGGLVRLLFDGRSQVIDLGRRTDTANKAQRLALIARDMQCRRCGAPPSWCEAHHIRWYSNGGRTDLDNLVLLCRACHQAIHEGGWRIRLHPDNSVTFTSKWGRRITRPPP